MKLPRKHFFETKKLLKGVPSEKVAKWLLEEGYFPEQYIVPPTFKVLKFDLNTTPFFEVDTTGANPKFEVVKSELITVSFPKTQLTDRTFGIIEPKIYHDIVWYLMNEWDLIIDHLFNSKNKIYSYSFPIPVTKKNEGELGHLRAGRMIYEFLEMAENDLVAEAFNYKYILKTDIKNFYPSIYTHSIAWAIHTKKVIRASGNRSAYNKFLGLKLDKLIQYANDGCTNGIPIGPAISDLIAEIILTAVDTEVSKEVDKIEIDFLAVRFKDDYRILCQSKEDTNKIIRIIQKKLQDFNLSLNDDKSIVNELPEGLFREWTADYHQFSLRYKNKITYNRLEKSLRGTLNVDKQHKGTGVVDRFLSELSSNTYNLKLDFNEKNLMKAISLLLLLKERRYKSFPQILAIIENIVDKYSSNKSVMTKIKNAIESLFNEKMKSIEDNQYDLIWLIYFIKSNELFTIKFPKNFKSPLIKCLKANRSEFFKPLPSEIKIFESIKKKGSNESMLEHLAVFKKE